MYVTHEESISRLSRIQPLALTGQFIRLEPIQEGHLQDLVKVGLDPDIWRLMLYGPMNSEADLLSWIKDMIRRQAQGKDLPFSVFQVMSGRAIGATRFMNIDAKNRSLEIGGTWYGKAYHGTGVNVEAKYLLLQHAFEFLGCIRVQLKTDARNLQSQKAILGIGATKEGVLRKHMVLPDGIIRDSVYFSILDDEWPQVKANLEARIRRLINSMSQAADDS
ncbi:MAG TPA: GNAT family protein [Anaerolineales bacterium]|nr:GNAT family protein [Anaerolineales bacterium]